MNIEDREISAISNEPSETVRGKPYLFQETAHRVIGPTFTVRNVIKGIVIDGVLLVRYHGTEGGRLKLGFLELGRDMASSEWFEYTDPFKRYQFSLLDSNWRIRIRTSIGHKKGSRRLKFTFDAPNRQVLRAEHAGIAISD